MLLEFLFPKTCVGCGKLGVYFCPSCSQRFSLASPICPMCGRGSIGGIAHVRCRRPLGIDGLVALFAYREGIQVAVKRLKYRFVREMGEAFVDLAHKRIESSLVSYFQRDSFRVVPVPLFRTRERRRGYNQAAVLGEFFALRLGLDFAPVLARVKNTQALAELQVRLSSNEEKAIEEKYLSLAQRRVAQWKLLAEKKSRLRAEEIRGAFKVSEKFKVKNAKLLLVDDVWTSGGTMLECAKTLKRTGASRVWGLAFSRGGR